MHRPRGGAVRRFLAVCTCAAAIILSSASYAAVFDPGAGWKTLTTPHFRIHHPERISDTAQRAGRIYEEIYPKITEEWHWKPWGRTEVVLTDSTDEANGMTSVLPYNWMIIYVAPPDADSSLANYDDWLRTLLLHEFTHLVQIDAYGGAMIVPRIFLGKTVSPSGMNPVWMREGVSQYDETYFTKAGRGRGSYSEMVIRAATLDGEFPTIDVADGLGWRWPGYKGAYVYGIGFIDWLIETYGIDRFMKLDHNIRSSLLLGMINHDARNVYGKTFYEMWSEWRQSLIKKYAELSAQIEAAGETKPSETIVPTGWDGQYNAPALSPDGTKLVYTANSPHGKTEIRLLDLATGETEVLRKGQDAVQYSWSPDGMRIVYASAGTYKNFNKYFDLWLYDFSIEKEKSRAKRLTNGKRARDPEFDRAGKSVIFVAYDNGTGRLNRIDVESKEITAITPNVPPRMQFANPRISPDGNFMAVSVWKPDEGWRIYRYAIDGSMPVKLTEAKGLIVESRPEWTPDGNSIVYSSDESGIANLYVVGRDGGQSRKLTNVITGVFQPQIASSGQIYAQYYTSKGFVIARFDGLAIEASKAGKASNEKKASDEKTASNVDSASKASNAGAKITGASAGGAVNTGNSGIVASSGSATEAGSTAAEIRTSGAKQNKYAKYKKQAAAAAAAAPPPLPPDADFKDEKYVAFGKSLFLPRFIVPYAMYGDGYVFASALTGGTDPLRWHNWAAAATYRSDANFLGYTFVYGYNRFKPIVGVTASYFAVDFGNIAFLENGALNIVHYFEKRQRASAYLAIPYKKHFLSLSYFFEDHRPKTTLTPAEQNALNLGHFAGFFVEYRYGDSEKYPASISRENGRNIKLDASITNKYFGSGDRNEQIIFAGDWREYVKLWRHHVLAFRGMGGMTWGDKVVQGTFGVGGALGEGQFASGGSYNYFPLRGLPLSAISATRAMVLSTEYRFPIYSLQRGLGTVPVYLKDISGAIFADYGDGWNAGNPNKDSIKTFFDDFFLGVGAELRGDFVIGHGLPIHGRVGYAIIVLNRDRLVGITDPIIGNNVKYGMLILSIGTIF